MLLLALALVLAACSSSPVGVSRVDPNVVHERLTRSALSNKQLSSPTYNVLLEADLDALYADDPEKALERLHDLAASGSGGPRQLFASAAASSLHAEPTRRPTYLPAAALYPRAH